MIAATPCYYCPAEAAERLGVHQATLARMVLRGLLTRPKRLGRQRFYDAAEIDARAREAAILRGESVAPAAGEEVRR